VKPAIWLAVVLSLAGSASSPVMAGDATDEYQQLLARDDALMQDLAQTSTNRLWLTRSMLNAKLKRLDADYRSFLEQHPRYAPAMVAYGGFLDDTGREKEAVVWWKKAIEADPRCAAAYNNLAVEYGEDGRPGDALRLHQQAYELDTNNPVFHYNWATTCILYRKDARDVYGWDTDEIFRHSLEQFRIARDLAPREFEYARAYAESFFMMKDPDWREAHAAWAFCLGQPLQPREQQGVYGQLARVCLHQAHYDEARQWITKLDAPDFQPMRRALERKLAAATPTSQPPP
jgi:tetratricopeptide (TPR) repeat protein